MNRTIRRQTRRAPSVGKHALSAALVIAILGLSMYAWANLTDTEPAAPRVEVRLPETIPTPAPVAIGAPPDLLTQENIPMDVNPTESMVLLGAPDDSGLAPGTGPRPPTQTNPQRPITMTGSGSGPKTILIDGQPINGASGAAGDNRPLIRAPIQGLSRMSPFGPVPAPSPDGRTALNRYAKPFAPQPGKRYVSIVVGGLGINPGLTRRAITELPGTVTLSFAAEAPGLQSFINQARNNGHEVMIELPMESTGGSADTQSSLFLKTGNPAETNIRNLDNIMSRAQGYFAVTNYGGDMLAANPSTSAPILAHLKAAGLGFIHDGSDGGRQMLGTAAAEALPFITANMLLDDVSNDRSTVRQNLSGITASAAAPLGMGFSYPGTIDGIKDWLAAKPNDVLLAPASYSLKQKSRS